jgi:hypothetical protein
MRDLLEAPLFREAAAPPDRIATIRLSPALMAHAIVTLNEFDRTSVIAV